MSPKVVSPSFTHIFFFCNFRKCWEKVGRTRLPDTKRVFSSYEEYQKYLDTEADETPTNLRNPREEGQSSDDEDEEQAGRWDWYIS